MMDALLFHPGLVFAIAIAALLGFLLATNAGTRAVGFIQIVALSPLLALRAALFFIIVFIDKALAGIWFEPARQFLDGTRANEYVEGGLNG